MYLEIVHKLPEGHFTAILLASHDIKTVPQCPLSVIVLCVCGVVCAGVVCAGVVCVRCVVCAGVCVCRCVCAHA